jgi:lysophospholipase L1-like esterase
MNHNNMPDSQTIGSWVFLAGVDVQATAETATIVTFGDSITDGAASTVNENHRWPDYLYSRLLANKVASASRSAAAHLLAFSRKNGSCVPATRYVRGSGLGIMPGGL